LINILGVSSTDAVFLGAHDSSSLMASSQNIANILQKTIDEVGPTNVIQVITDNATNCKGAGKNIERKYTHIFWSGCLVHTLCMISSSIKNAHGLMICTSEGRNSLNLSPSIQGLMHFMALTLNCNYLSLQRLDLEAISSPSAAY
jgi:hypothetical protein